ncbi:MAG TPA: amino acid--tRNA ligase-related protein [Glycomyces sp.]|nr:amino acid--tRNA ligase-related protein [Glycomyces sp.]
MFTPPIENRAFDEAGAVPSGGIASATLSHLRDPRTRRNLAIRQSIVTEIREQLLSESFQEFETPVLGERIDEYSSGIFRAESARGDELWLVQSPQLFKQTLIAAGYPRYLQFAHCFRDEAPEAGRYDRMREFVQVDIEMETADAAQVRRLVERLFKRICAAVGREVATPFPEIDAVTAVAEYGTDRPDLRSGPDDWSFVWVVDFPMAARDAGGTPRLERHPMAQPTEIPVDAAHACELRTRSYDLVLNGYEIGSGDLRIHDPRMQEAVLKAMDLPPEQFDVLLEVLASGCPPHGGVGIGLDRLTMALGGSFDIAEASAFPHWFGCVRPEERP